jgi:hypothetical protein
MTRNACFLQGGHLLGLADHLLHRVLVPRAAQARRGRDHAPKGAPCAPHKTVHLRFLGPMWGQPPRSAFPPGFLARRRFAPVAARPGTLGRGGSAPPAASRGAGRVRLVRGEGRGVSD